jgi:hypothetical protein
MPLYPEQEKSKINMTGGIQIGGVDMTSTAAELSALHSQAASSADFAKLHAVTASAAQLNNTIINADGLGFLGVARFTFDASIAGNQSIAGHGTGVTLPANAVVCGGFFDVNTVFHSAGGDAGTVAISIEGANDIQTAAAVSGAPYSTIGRKAIVPKANTPESTSVKTTVAREITCTVAGQILSAGKLTGFLYFVVDVVSA